MSTLYQISHERDKVIEWVKANPSLGIEVVHRPILDDGEQSQWPWGLTDGKSYVWFDSTWFLIKWGLNDPTNIFKALKQIGVKAKWVG